MPKRKEDSVVLDNHDGLTVTLLLAGNPMITIDIAMSELTNTNECQATCPKACGPFMVKLSFKAALGQAPTFSY